MAISISVYRRYSLEEVKRKVFAELQYSDSGLSGVELASRLKINRMTLTKYLDLMSAKGLIRKKKLVR